MLCPISPSDKLHVRRGRNSNHAVPKQLEGQQVWLLLMWRSGKTGHRKENCVLVICSDADVLLGWSDQGLNGWVSWHAWEVTTDIFSIFFYILLTVHHVMIFGKWPTRRGVLFYLFIFVFNCLHVSSTSCLSSGETNRFNATSCSCQWSCRVQVGSSFSTCIRHGHRHRVIATRGCIDKICLSWWWARCVRNIQRVKSVNKCIEKNCASRWSCTKNHYMMHGQQNIKKCT